MSYILEALQRADQERKRAQPALMPTVVDGALVHASPYQRDRRLGWVMVAALLLLALLVWSQFSSEAPPTAAVETKGVSIHVVTPLVKQALSEPAAVPVPEVVVEASVIKTVVPQQIVKQTVVTAAAATPSALAIAPTPVMLAQLPIQIRAQLPEMHISALIDHQDPAQRVAWINDRALHIGQWITGSVQLVAIGAGDVTLAFQGYRIVVTPFDQGSRLWRE